MTLVGRSDDMAFLATLAVDDLKSQVDSTGGFFVANDLHPVNGADEVVLACLSIGELRWAATSFVGDHGADFTSLVRMSLLEHSHADELMGRDVLVEPHNGILCESLPVGVTAGDDMRVSSGVAHLIGVPSGLATSTSDVLRGTRDRNEVRLAAVHLEVVGGLLLLLPGLLVVEAVELDVVNWASTTDDGLLAVEECQHLVAFLDIVLVRGDGDDLVSSEVVFTDPCL